MLYQIVLSLVAYSQSPFTLRTNRNNCSIQLPISYKVYLLEAYVFIFKSAIITNHAIVIIT